MSKKAAGPSEQVGLRERNRLDKLARIKAAAAGLFTELGFDRATTRAIAKRAHVGLGTLFNYADDKRDLVFLIFNEELDRITDRAFAAVNPREPPLDQLLTAFGVFYREFGARATLARILLQELTFYSGGRLAADFQRSRRRTVGFIETLVRAARREGRIRTDENPAFIALTVFYVYAGAVRRWIAARRPDPKAGLRELRRALELLISGLAAGTRADSTRRRRR